MTNVLATAGIAVEVNGSQAKSGLQEIKREVQSTSAAVAQAGQQSTKSFGSIGTASEAAGGKVSNAGARVLRSLEQQANRLSLTTAEYAKLRAAQAGVSNEAAPLIARIEAATTRATGAMGMSAAAQAAAMRNVPAQFTDIIVGLQGGQAPLTVLLQQGGQLKDMFGGVGAAAKALGGYVAGLASPFTVAAAAGAGLALAYYRGTVETENFQRALILTGGSVDKTAGQLSQMATALSGVAGSRGAAVDTITALARGAKVASSDLANVARGLASIAATGAADLEEVVKEVESLGTKPSETLAKLNEKYGFLTLAVYEQVKALEAQGRQQEATSLAQNTLANAFERQAEMVRQNLGTLERGWASVKSAALGAWEAMKGVGREATVNELTSELREAQKQYAAMRSAGGFATTAGGAAVGGARGSSAGAEAQRKAEMDRLSARIQMLQQQETAALIKNRQRETEAEKIAASERLADLAKESKSRKQQREEKIAAIKRDAEITGQSAKDTAALIAAVEEKYKDPKGAAAKEAASVTFLQKLREQEASLQLQLATDTKLTAETKARVEFEQMLADLKGKKTLTAQQKSFLAEADLVRAQLEKNESLAEEIRKREALQKLIERGRQIEQSIASSRESRQEQYDKTIDAFGQGDQALQRVTAQTAIRREFQRYQEQLAKATPKELLGTKQYLDQVASIRSALQQALVDQETYYARVDELQTKGAMGALQALANYSDAASNTYRMVGSAATNWISGFEDRLTQAVTTGKLKFRDLANSIIGDLIRIQLRQNVISPLLNLAGSTIAGLVSPGGFSTPQASVGGTIPTVDLTGGRAGGGPVAANRFYEVNERGPELYTTGGRSYLMAGSQGGYVTPISSGSHSAAQVSVAVNIQGDGERQSSASPGYEQFGQELAAFVEQKFRELQAKSARQGGMSWQQRNGAF